MPLSVRIEFKNQGQNQQNQGEQQAQGQVELNEPNEPIKTNEPSRGDISAASSRGREGKELIVESTSYSHTGNRTFSGTWPQEGVTIAVDNQKIKVGSRVYIYELNNWYLAEDLIPASSVKKGAIIDIFQNDIGDCWQWGRRDVQIKVIPPQNQAPQK